MLPDILRKRALKRAEISALRSRLRDWYQRLPGKQLGDTERAELDALIQTLFGYHALQVGRLVDEDILSASRIPHRVIMDPDKSHNDLLTAFAYPDALPVASDAVDLVVLPHTLEFERNPHAVLREVDRVLIAEGHVVVLGFSPFSLWGLIGWCARRWGYTHPPWSTPFISETRVKDWLELLGFDVLVTRSFFFRPPLRSARVMRRLQFLERWGARWWPGAGGVYVLVARKRVTMLTPLKPRWRPRRSVIGKLAEPAATRSGLA